MIKKPFILILFITIFYNAFAQKPVRVEIETQSSDAYRITPFAEKGVMLFYESNEKKKTRSEDVWYFSFYSSSFKKLWSKELKTSKAWSFRGVENDSDNLYMFFAKPYFNAKTPIMIIEINIKNGEHKLHTTEIPVKSDVSEFVLSNKNAFIGGETEQSDFAHVSQTCFSFTLVPFITGWSFIKTKPVIYTWDLNNESGQLVATEFKKETFVESIQPSANQNSANYLIKNDASRKDSYLYIYDIDSKGNQNKTIRLESDDNQRRLNNGKIHPIDESNKIIIGTYYAMPKNKMFYSKDQTKRYSSGIYFTKLTNDNQETIKYYNFSKFKNLIYSFNKRRTKRMIKKASKLEAQGKEVSFNYQLLFHDIIERDNQYIVIAEAYYPQYRTVYYTYYDIYGRPITTSYTVFEGYRYTDAIVAAFDIEGNLLWDNTFRIRNILTHYLKERVKVVFEDQDIILLYSSEGKIASKVIRGNEVVEGLEFIDIETTYDNDKILNDYNSDIVFWYDNYFISYGYQKIKNNVQLRGKEKRRNVFYFNKIAFQ